VLLALEQLARGEGTTPWPLIAEGIATVIQAEIRTATDTALSTRLAELDDLSFRARTHRAALADHRARATAAVQRAELDLERAAIHRELARREAA
jgi:hypothetical protein